MRNFTRQIITEWRKLNLPFAGETMVIAVSGGADSVALLLAIDELRGRKKLTNRFVVAHFNHDLRGEQSAEDAEFVRGLTTRLNFEFVCKIQSPESEIRNQAGNLEQNARTARYIFLLETAENLDARYVLTAHTLNDNAETFLMNLLRGSGLDGLSGIKPVRDLRLEEKSEIRLVRPLLNWAKREDTENFCLFNKVEYRNDAMNDDLKFNRVRVRKILLPMLREFNPKIVETLAQTAKQLSVISYQLSEKRRVEIKEQKTVLSISDLRDVFPPVLRTMLRDWVKTNRGSLRGLQSKHFEAIENLIFSRKSGRIVELPNGESVLKTGGKLHFQPVKVEKS